MKAWHFESTLSLYPEQAYSQVTYEVTFSRAQAESPSDVCHDICIEAGLSFPNREDGFSTA